MHREQPCPDPEEADEAEYGEGMSEVDLEAEIQGELSEMRQMVVEFGRLLIAKGRQADSADELVKLSNAANRAARAHRQIGVLQLEIAGKRPLPGTRAPREASAVKNGEPSPEVEAQSERRVRSGLPFEYGDYDDYDDYTEDERVERDLRQLFLDRKGPLLTAMDEDFKAAGRADIVRESPKTKYKLIYYIPHPNLDR